MLTFFIGFYFGGAVLAARRVYVGLKHISDAERENVNRAALVYVFCEHVFLWPYFELLQEGC